MNTASLIVVILFIPLFGAISDYFDRITLLKIIALIFLILALPYFWCINYGAPIEALSMYMIISIFSACFFSIASVVIAEAFPLKIRCASIALIYQVVASLAAGLMPMMLLHITRETHAIHASVMLMMESVVEGLVCLIALRRVTITA